MCSPFSPVMSVCNASLVAVRKDASNVYMFRRSESSDDDDKRLKRREKNRVAAQRSRKRQTQRADELHEAYECLEQENSSLRKEVQLLIEEQRLLTEALKAHEPLCPVLNCSINTAHRAKESSLPPGSVSR